jgi:uncharacterized protein
MDKERYHKIAGIYENDERILRMRKYIQHGNISTYDHVKRVAETSYMLNHRFRCKANDHELIKGAFLHDYFLYDWHERMSPLHGFYHPKAALKNAERDFTLSEREKNIIRSHMWPLTLGNIPRCREAWIVSAADKICSLKETLMMRR